MLPGEKALSPLEAEQAAAPAAARRMLRMAEASGRPWLALLGLGQGVLAATLLDNLPAGHRLVILEHCPHHARRVLTRFPHLLPHLLVDVSPWALLLLAHSVGLTPDNVTMSRGQASGRDDDTVLGQWRKLFLGGRREVLPEHFSRDLRISVAAILHPTEARLREFFGHIPPWVYEVCVVWDGFTPPLPRDICKAPLLSRMRPLNGHFGEQRNAMLDLCSGDWCLYLDADERLSPKSWESLYSLASVPNAGGVLFPRLTFEGNQQQVRMGYGLWPDVQCRFFPLRTEARFHGTIHEQLRGLGGHRLLAAGLPILHYSHVHKSSTQVEEKLKRFDEAAGFALHTHSQAYPCLPLSEVAGLGQCFGRREALRLPAIL